eukprot:jgi/Chlat1/1049/Chrsp110S01534
MAAPAAGGAVGQQQQPMEERWAFTAEWLDPMSGVTWHYQLLFWPADSSLEMFDVKNRRVFLKRCEYPSVQKEHVFVGSAVSVYARHLKLTGYADEYTRKRLTMQSERTLGLVKPDALKHLGKILDAAYSSGFTIGHMRMCRLALDDAKAFYAVHTGKSFYQGLTEFISSGRIVAMELIATDAVQRWRNLIGPTSTMTARQSAPQSLRAHYGTDERRNACHGSDSPSSAQQELDFFFGPATRLAQGAYASGSDPRCSCVIVKPHALLEGHAGAIIDAVLSRYDVTALEMFKLDRPRASEFLEVYRGVVPEYSAMVEELTSGPCIVMEVRPQEREASNAHESVRALCGPSDAEIARALRPDTLRALYGKDKVRNAVHCTDLPEDGPLEVSYFFNLMQHA